jgi:succinate dehydrogenase / fumarate reductase membrane anchor subunit
MSLSGSGSRDWLVQRFTAVFLAIYTIYIFIFILRHPDFSYDAWLGLFSRPFMQLSTLFALFSVALHAWVGLWTVLTDYVKPLILRYLLQAIILLALFVYVVWGIFILWGN